MNGNAIVGALMGGSWVGAVVITIVKGNEQVVLWLILAMMAGLFALVYKGLKEISGMNALLFGEPKKKEPGLYLEVMEKRMGLKQRMEDHEDALRVVLQCAEITLKTASDSSTYEEFRKRMETLADLQEGEVGKIRRKVKGLSLVPNAFREAD